MGKDTIIKYKEGNTAFFDRGVPPEIFSSETSGSVLQAVSEYIVKDEDHSKTKEPEAKSKEPSKVETKPTQEIPAKVTKSRKKHPVSKKKINPKVNDNVIKKPRQPTLAQQLKVKFDAREPLKTDDDVMNFAQRGFVKGYKSIKEIDTLLKRANEIVDTGLKGNALNKALNQSLLTEFPLRKT